MVGGSFREGFEVCWEGDVFGDEEGLEGVDLFGEWDESLFKDE